jgi:anti-anti-sigma factor
MRAMVRKTMGMEWLIRTTGNLLEVRVRGDLDLYHASGFAAEILERIARGSSRLRLDLSELVYLDSTGVGALIRILRAAKRAGGDVAFSGLAGSPRRVLEMSGILPLLCEVDGRAAER